MRNLTSLMLALFVISTYTMSNQAQEGGLLLLPNDLTSKAIIRSMDISNDGKYVIALAFYEDGQNASITTFLWNLDQVSSDQRVLPAFARTDIMPFFTFRGNVAFSPDNQHFVTHTEDSLLIYKTSEIQLVSSYAISNNRSRTVAWSEDSQLVGALYHHSSTDEQEFTVWDIANGDIYAETFDKLLPLFTKQLNDRWLFLDNDSNLHWCDLRLQQCDQWLSDGRQGDIVVGNNFFLQLTYLHDEQVELVFWEETPEGFAQNQRFANGIVKWDYLDAVSNNRQFVATFAYLWNILSGRLITNNLPAPPYLFTSDNRIVIAYDSRRLIGYDTNNGAEAFSVDLGNYLGTDTTGFFIEDKQLYKLSADEAFALVSFYNFAALVPIPPIQ